MPDCGKIDVVVMASTSRG